MNIKRNKEKLKAIIRDNFECQRCGVNLYLRKSYKEKGSKKAHFHHIIHKSKGGSHKAKNLLSTCWDCECKAHNRKGKT